MTQYWEPGTQYNYNDVVEYEGVRYKIIQPHRSQGDWTPPVTPALWGRMQGNDHGHSGKWDQPQQQKPECDDKPQQHQQQQPIQPPPQYGSNNSNNSGNQGDSGDEGKKGNWFDDHKKELGIAGGVVGGAALLAGGLFAYKKHEEHNEEAASQQWASNNWLEEARGRAAAFSQYGPQGKPYTWFLTSGKNIPNGALLIGTEHSWNLYVCRALHDGALVLGKASDAFKKGGVLGTQNKEVHTETYEILLADPNRIRWVPYSGRFSIASLGAQPIEGGREANGTKIYVIQAFHKGAVHPGKIGEGWDTGYIPYDGHEKAVSDYKVLCLA